MCSSLHWSASSLWFPLPTRSTATSMAHIGIASAAKLCSCVVIGVRKWLPLLIFIYFHFHFRLSFLHTQRIVSRVATRLKLSHTHIHIELHNEVRRCRHDHMYATGTYEFLFRFIESINNSCTHRVRGARLPSRQTQLCSHTHRDIETHTQDTHAYKLLLSPIYSTRKMYSRKRSGRFNSCLCTWLSAVISHALRVMFIKGKAYHMPSRECWDARAPRRKKYKFKSWNDVVYVCVIRRLFVVTVATVVVAVRRRWRRCWSDAKEAGSLQRPSYLSHTRARVGLLRKSCTLVNIPSINIFHFRQLAWALSKIDTFSAGKNNIKNDDDEQKIQTKAKCECHTSSTMEMERVCVSLCVCLCKLLNPMSRCQYFAKTLRQRRRRRHRM